MIRLNNRLDPPDRFLQHVQLGMRQPEKLLGLARSGQRPEPLPTSSGHDDGNALHCYHSERAEAQYPSSMPTKARERAKTYPVEELVERLEAVYGETPYTVRFDPMEELVCCILSQHTSDANSFPAFARLRAAYPTWEEVVDAGPEKIADVIRAAGLANQKSKGIIRCLQEIKKRTGDYSLEHLRSMPMLEARDWLVSLPGVGPKTASIVLCFALGMEAIPVDTHVYRVSWRIGLIPEGIGETKAHDLLLRVVPAKYAFRFHMACIHHGRATCKAPLPICAKCPVTHMCRWYREGGARRALPASRQGMRNEVQSHRPEGDATNGDATAEPS
jgi:endonuclease-3